MSHPASVLEGIRGERVALCGVAISAVLRDLLAEVTVSQTYRNDEKVNIEAVYTFPLPPDAVLLGLFVTIGGRALKGTVVEKKAAEERYEDAIAHGNSAVMLEQVEAGLYTMNVGNLLPGETAEITFTYAVMYRWAGDNLRMLIPTTIAPRYGESPLQPHQAPEHSLTVENQFSIQIDVFGSLRDATFECPSHEVTLNSSSDKTAIALSSARAAMDRDFILNVKAPLAMRGAAVCGADGDGATVLAVVQPVFPGLRKPRKLNLAVVIDCSGSMKGDSITQAKRALAGILDGLQRGDRITIVAFGNTTNSLFDDLQPCTEENLRRARQFTNELDASMGGTEIGGALQVAYAATRGSDAADILLVTDGEVSEWKRVVEDAKKSGRRIFTVGVGSAVSEAFVRELATVTGGGCELVSPQEGMADRVVRHVERMREPRAKRVVVHWPEGARNQAPARFNTVFEGDTVVASAQFDRSSVTGHVVMEIETESGQVFRQEVAIGQAPAPQSGSRVSTVARIAAGERIKELEGKAAAQTAVQYQLASPWTNWLVVAERPDGEKAFNIPEIRKVKQTLAAGWGGVGIGSLAEFTGPVAQRVMRRMDISASLEGPAFFGDDLAGSPAGPDDEAVREKLRLEFLSDAAEFAERVGRLSDEFEAFAGDARRSIRELQVDIEKRIRRVMAGLKAIERKAEEMERELEELAARAPEYLHSDAIAETRARLEALRERLHHPREMFMRLRQLQELLRDVKVLAAELTDPALSIRW